MLEYQLRWMDYPCLMISINFIQEKKLLSCFVSELDKESFSWVLRDIGQVLSGQETYIECDLECYGVKLRPDVSTIYNEFDENNDCEDVSTNVLKEAVEIWTREREAFYKWIRNRTDSYQFPIHTVLLPGVRANFYWLGKPGIYRPWLGFEPWKPRLSDFLAAIDSREAYEALAEDIRRVQGGEAESIEREGAVIGQEITVLNRVSVDDDKGEERLSTDELKAVAAFWMNELERYREYVERHGPPEDYRVDAQGCEKAVPPSLCKRLWVKIKRRK